MTFKSYFAIASLSFVAVSASRTNAQSSAAGSRPNIIFVLADDLGYGDIGVFFQNLRKTNNNRAEPWHFTPQLDQFAAEGVQLRGQYCPSPVCAPSRASLLLGVHQGHANVRDNQFDKALESNHTLASVLKRAGYATAAIGKWGLAGSGGSPAAWPAYPTKRGFDYYFGYVRHGDGHEHYPKEGIYGGQKEVWDQDTNISNQLDKSYTADLFTARAKKWIVDEHAAHPDQPFFLYLAYDTPHAQTQLPTQAYPAGGGLTGGLQWLGTPGQMINTASGTVDGWYHPDYANATWDDDNNSATPEVAWPDVYKRYATAVRRLDEALGDLVQTLKDLGVDDNTLIIFTTDNGPSNESYLSQAFAANFFNSFGPFDGIKRDTWEGGIRVGALARWPAAIPPNRVDEQPSQFHDWLPTFAEAAGVPIPARTDGVSLLPSLTGSGSRPPSTVYVEYYYAGNTPSYSEFQSAKRGRTRNQMQTLRLGDYVGVRYNVASQADNFEIYDVVDDPQELVNLAPSQTGLQQLFKDTVLRLRRPDSDAARPYDSDPVPPSNPSPVTHGVQWSAYEGEFPWVPKLDAYAPSSSGTAARPDLAVRPRDNDIGILFSGYIQAPADGDYTFYVKSDRGALLRIHQATVVDGDFGHNDGSEKSGTIKLKAGRHPFRLYYERGSEGAPELSLQWSSASIAKQPVPDAAFYRDGVGPAIPPSGVEDTADTPQNTPVTVDVLANDIDDGTPQQLWIVSATPGVRGTTAIVDGKIVYTPDAGFLGTDTFSYVLSDGAQTATAKVRVNVTFFDGTYWFPFNQKSGLATREAGGGTRASLLGFPSDSSQWVAGKFNRALSFDGVDDYVSVTGFNGIQGAGARTVAAWVRTTYAGGAGDRPIIAWGANTSGNKWTFLMNTAGRIRLECTGGWVVGTKLINDGQWHHVAATFANDGTPTSTDVKLYVDGTLETISTSQSVAVNTTTPATVKIGSDTPAQNRYWLGQIDEPRIYNRALAAAEVLALVQSTDATEAAWTRRYFGNGAVDWSADDDDDGAPRTGEYAFGTEPGIAAAGSPLVTGIVAGTPRITFPRRPEGTSSLAYQLESSTDLVDWAPQSFTEISVVARDEEFEDATLDAQPPVGAKKFFLRVRATLGAATFATDPAGFVFSDIAPGSVANPANSFVAPAFAAAPDAVGTVSAVSGPFLTLTGVDWSGGPFGPEHYLEITSGSYAGSWAPVASADPAAKIVSAGSDFAALVSSGVKVALRRFTTLGDFLGASNSAGLAGASALATADEVVVYRGATPSVHWYYDGTGGGTAGWYDSAYNPTADTLLPPGQGMVIRRKAPSPLVFSQSGIVKRGPTTVAAQRGLNLVGNPSALDLTLDASQLQTGNPAWGVAAASSLSAADEVILYGAGTPSVYWRYDGSQGGAPGWYDSSYQPAGSVVIPAGSSFSIQRKADAFRWNAPAPLP